MVNLEFDCNKKANSGNTGKFQLFAKIRTSSERACNNPLCKYAKNTDKIARKFMGKKRAKVFGNFGVLKIDIPGNSNAKFCEYAIKPYEIKIQVLSDNKI